MDDCKLNISTLLHEIDCAVSYLQRSILPWFCYFGANEFGKVIFNEFSYLEVRKQFLVELLVCFPSDDECNRRCNSCGVHIRNLSLIIQPVMPPGPCASEATFFILAPESQLTNDSKYEIQIKLLNNKDSYVGFS